MSTKQYTVSGMTCSHCAQAVKDEIHEISGITDVEVDVDSGAVVVTGEGFSDQAIEAAVKEAGYEVVS